MRMSSGGAPAPGQGDEFRIGFGEPFLGAPGAELVPVQTVAQRDLHGGLEALTVPPVIESRESVAATVGGREGERPSITQFVDRGTDRLVRADRDRARQEFHVVFDSRMNVA